MKNLPQLWGGIECTVNRIGHRYFDQCVRSGHDRRLGDLDLIAELGIKVLRYPVIWEKVAPNGLAGADWSMADERMNRLRDLGIEPIVGLVHHGSGPPHTSLISDDFADGLAEFAEAVALRYPWVRYYTPVNEPLTTARFSALYGHWYPHHRDDVSFLRAILVQCKAICKAMAAIREVRPDALLVQTEDMGKVYGTPLLTYQVEFENDRRWLSLDLLCGRMMSARMRQYVRKCGIEPADLNWFAENACPPDIIGLNHYVTSERYLDEEFQGYPPCYHGGNGVHSYADVEAVRTRVEIGNIHMILREAWRRYRRPLAITEAHLGDVAVEQMRWLWERWSAAIECIQEGIDVRAVTAWSLFGAFDWNSLLTRFDNCYEPGAFDVRCDPPEPTELTLMIRSLATTGTFQCAELATPGWWRRPERVLYPNGNLVPFAQPTVNTIDTAG